MKQRIYQAEYAGNIVRYRFRRATTWYYFGPYIEPAAGDEYDISATEEQLARMAARLPEDSKPGYIESRTLISLTASHLLRYGCTLIHSAAVSFRGKAWLIAAPSGTGKTTQYLNFQGMYPGEAEMICGDMPAIRLEDDGTVTVHPSPWNGKEDFSGSPAAPLGGIVLLEQGNDDRLTPMPPSETVTPLLRQFLCKPDTVEETRALMKVLDGLLSKGNVTKLVNRGGEKSTALLRKWMEEAYEKV